MTKPRKLKTKQTGKQSWFSRFYDSTIGKAIIFSITVLGLFGIVFGIWSFWGFTPIKNMLRPISVDPKEMSIQQAPWKTYTGFIVHNNRDDKTEFAVWVMISLDDCTIESSHILIDTPDSASEPVGSVGNISASFNCVRMDGTANGKQAIFMIINRLTPSETRSFSVIVDPDSNDIVGKQARMTLKIVGYSGEAIKLISDGGQLAYQFKPPISFEMKSVSIYFTRID